MGTGYVRRSTTQIATGEVIEAADFNNEFNDIVSSFTASTGHSHDGTTSEGGDVTKLLGTAITIGDGSAGTDIVVTFDGETTDGVLTWMEDEDHFKFSDDIVVDGTKRLYFNDEGGEYIHGDGTDLNLVSGADINIPASIGLTFGNDGEKIEGDGTDLTIAGNNINLTAVADVVIPADVGITFGDAGEKIEGDGSDLTISSSAVLTLDAGGNIVIDSDGTVDVNSVGVLTLDSGAAINIEPATGSAILLDGTISVDAGVVTGATSITSTAFVGDVTGDITGTADVATVATTVTITDNESTNESNAIIFTAGGDVDGGNIGLESDGTLTYNPSTGKITATGFIGALTGDVTGDVTGTSDVATVATTVTITDNESTNESNAIIFTAGGDVDGGNLGLESDGTLTYNPSTGKITATGFIGALTGDVTGDVTGTADVATVATTVTITDNESTNESNALIFTAGGDVDGGNLGLESDGTLTYNPSTGVVTATGFVGALTGNVTGNASGTAATVTGAAQTAITSVGTLTALTVDDVAVNGKVITMTGDTSDTVVITAGAAGTLSIVTTDAAGADGDIQITADGTVDIDSAGVLTLDSGAAINIEPATGSAILLDGTISVDAGVVTGATSVTSTAFVGGLTGNVTGNASGTAATVTGAAQTAITSVGTLTALTVDDVAVNGKVITMTGDTSDTVVVTAGAAGTLSIVTTDAAGADGNITITADGTFEADGTTITLDSAGDIDLNAGGGDIFFKEASTTFGSATNSSGELVLKSGTTTALTFSGADATLAGDLTISGDDLFMATNTSGHILVADGTNYNPVAVSGDVGISAAGAITIASTAIESGMLNNNIISGQTALASGLATTDEILVSDAGTLKRVDVSVLTEITDGSATALAIALG